MACDNTDAHRDARLEYLRVYLESADRDGQDVQLDCGLYLYGVHHTDCTEVSSWGNTFDYWSFVLEAQDGDVQQGVSGNIATLDFYILQWCKDYPEVQNDGMLYEEASIISDEDVHVEPGAAVVKLESPTPSTLAKNVKLESPTPSAPAKNVKLESPTPSPPAKKVKLESPTPSAPANEVETQVYPPSLSL